MTARRPGEISAMLEAPSVAKASSVADFERRARSRLTLDLAAEALDPTGRSPEDGRVLQPGVVPRAAAVLIPVVARQDGATVLLTLRTSHLRDHSGQIALPGGKIDPSDASPAVAALREAEEEVGLSRRHVTPLGYLDPYLTGTGFLVIPTVAIVQEPFTLTLNPFEVEEAFEVPLAFLMEAANHQRGSRELGGVIRQFYVMPYESRRIWGITAGIIRKLYERLYL